MAEYSYIIRPQNLNVVVLKDDIDTARNIMEKINNIIKILTMKIKEDTKRQCNKNVAMSVIVCISAGIMLIMNIIKHSTLMTITSIILVGGFAITGIIAGVFKKSKVSSVIMAIILTGVFTVFPISGGNEGFAVLWILLIPLFSISLFGLEIGMGMNIYFMALVLVLFYTPLSAFIADLYTSNFLSRFPVLFIADSAVAQFLAFSSEYYYRITRLQLYTDHMTGIYNRKYFIEMLEDKETKLEGLCISVIDINGLKETNDTLGHAAGDELICAVPILAKEAFGKDVIISRMGGDEFAILSYGSSDEVSEKIMIMKDCAAKYKGQLINAVYLSTGTACYENNEGLTCEDLLKKADQLMYDDKAAFYQQKGHDRRRR